VLDIFSGLPDHFNSVWRQAACIEKCSVKDVDAFIQAHYLRKRPAIVLLVLRMLVRGEPVGMIVYSAPPRESNKRYGGETWELARLYLIDEVPRNAETWLIGQSVKWIKRNAKHVKHLVSYADPSQGHAGVIYKASNWLDDGKTDSERKTPRFDYVDARTGKKYGRRGNVPKDAVLVRQPRVSKHRFHLPLC
jgi:hypothetical protein